MPQELDKAMKKFYLTDVLPNCIHNLMALSPLMKVAE